MIEIYLALAIIATGMFILVKQKTKKERTI